MLQRPRHRSSDSRPAGRPWGLLVESADPALAISDHIAFRDAGFDVTLCRGPDQHATDCPLVRGEQCPVVDSADVVFFDTDYGLARPEVLEALQAAKPELPVVVRTSDTDFADSSARTIPSTSSVPGQVSALRKAVLAR